jgi:hypothetical protein
MRGGDRPRNSTDDHDGLDVAASGGRLRSGGGSRRPPEGRVDPDNLRDFEVWSSGGVAVERSPAIARLLTPRAAQAIPSFVADGLHGSAAGPAVGPDHAALSNGSGLAAARRSRARPYSISARTNLRSALLHSERTMGSWPLSGLGCAVTARGRVDNLWRLPYGGVRRRQRSFLARA